MTALNDTMLRGLIWLQKARSSEEGQGLVEYGLIVALIAVVCVTALTGLGNGVKTKLQSVSTTLGG